MKLYRDEPKDEVIMRPGNLFYLWAIAACLIANLPASGSSQVVIWDTIAPLADNASLENRSGWKAVPGDLLALEADPPKASSDPGYYGREYTFKGDAVIENHHLAALFWAAKGRVVLYSKGTGPSPAGAVSPTSGLGKPITEITPLPGQIQPARITRCEIVRHATDEAALKVFFSGGAAEMSILFVFDRTEIVEIKPVEMAKGFRLTSPLAYGIVPGFIGDDLIYGAGEYPAMDTLCIPSHNIFLGLLKGEESELALTWPKGSQQLKLQLGRPQDGQRLIESVDFENDGQSLYLAALSTPGLWHRELLTAAFLEKDLAIQWKRPFPAKWTTQLYEGAVKTTFAFRDGPGQVWRGVPGQYRYPVWFNGETANYHLSKKIPPKGESLTYFLEGKDTPLAVTTPVDILKATLGRQIADTILDLAGRKLRTHHRRGGEGVRRACTCGCTEAIQAVFEAGEECAKKEVIAQEVDDMIFFVQRHVERIDEYRSFADDLIKFLRAQGAVAPELKPFLDQMEQLAGQIGQEYSVQKENMKSLEYAADLSRQTLALTSKKDPNNLKANMELLKAWRAMGGAQDYVVAQCHTITRKLCQEAGYGCAAQAKAVALAEEIQKRCRQCLRNPDGYEIWADY